MSIGRDLHSSISLVLKVPKGQQFSGRILDGPGIQDWVAKGHLILDEALHSTHCARPTQLQTSRAGVDLWSFHLLHLLHSGFLICQGLKLFFVGCHTTQCTWGLAESAFYISPSAGSLPFVPNNALNTLWEKCRAARLVLWLLCVKMSLFSGSRPEALAMDWFWDRCKPFLQVKTRTPWSTKFPLNLMTSSSFSPHTKCITVKLSINDHWRHWKKNMQS